MTYVPTPEITSGLLKFLEQFYPDRLPDDLDIPDRTLWAQIGQQKLIRHLRRIHREQQESSDVSSLR